MIWRTFDTDAVAAALEQSKDDLMGCPIEPWLANKDNIALRDDYGNISLFEYRQEGAYTGHYFFLQRGRDAVLAAEDMLHEIFSDWSPVHIIIGTTPVDKKGALWMSRHLGFHHYGDEEIDGRLHRIFIMTKKDYMDE